MGRFRRWAGRLTGTFIFSRLPRGVALNVDLKQARPVFLGGYTPSGALQPRPDRSFA
jgi:hypothetical protein